MKLVAAALGIAIVVAGIVFGWAVFDLRDPGPDDYEAISVTFTEEPTLTVRTSDRRTAPQFRVQRGVDPTGEIVVVRGADFEIGETDIVQREIGTRQAVIGPVEESGPKYGLAGVFAGLAFIGAGVMAALIALILTLAKR